MKNGIGGEKPGYIRVWIGSAGIRHIIDKIRDGGKDFLPAHIP